MKNLSIASSLLIIPAFAYLIVAIGWLLNINCVTFAFPASLLLTIATLWIVFRKKEGAASFLKTTGTIVFFIALPIILCTLSYDYSYDGTWYHQTDIYSIINGWNPVYEKSPFTNDSNALWINHYAKGIETMAACIAAFIGNIESGKAINFILVASCFFFVLDFIRQYLPNATKLKTIGYSLLITLSPVVVCQWLTFDIDWSLYVLFVDWLVCIFNISIKRYKRLCYIILLTIIALSFAIKFNIAFWICLLQGIYVIVILYLKKWRQLRHAIFISIAGATLGCAILAFNPYITNLRDGHHILYPLMGQGKVDIMDINTHAYLSGKSRITSVFISLFSRPNNVSPYSSPYQFKKHNLIDAGKADCRIGGFGLLFIEILILSILLIILHRKVAKDKTAYYSFIGFEAALFLFLFLLPAGWWSRYVGFFYLFPCAALLFAEKEKRYTVIKNILTLLMFCNISLSFVVAIGASVINKTRVDTYLDLFSHSQTPRADIKNASFLYKLEENHISFEPCDTASFKLDMFGPDVLVVHDDCNWQAFKPSSLWMNSYSKTK